MNARILVVDDDPDLRQATARALRTAGYEVTEAGTGADAIRLARAERPALILLDAVLPDLDGGEVCRRIKADPELEDVSVVLVSGLRTSSQDQTEGLEGGTDGSIARPIRDRELLAQVAALLRLRGAELELRQRTAQLEALRSVTAEMTSELDFERLLHLIVERAARLGGAVSASIFLWDETSKELVEQVSIGMPGWFRGIRRRAGEGLSSAVAERRCGLIVNELRESPYAMARILAETDIARLMGEPLLYRDRLVGVLSLRNPRTAPPFSEEDARLLRLFADQATIAVENARLHEAARQHARQLALLNDLTRRLVAPLDSRRVGEETLQAVQALYPGAGARLWEVPAEGETDLTLVASIGVQDVVGGARRFRWGEGLGGIAAKTRQPVVSRDVLQDPRFVNKAWAEREGARSAVVCPLTHGDQVLGILALFLREVREFRDNELQILQSLVAHAAIALANARLHAAVHRHAGELETRVRERTRALEEALQVKAEFLARMSHELRTPLNFVLGFADLLRQESAGPLTPVQQRYVDRIWSGGSHLLGLVTDLLDLSANDIGQRRLELESIPLALLAQEILEFFSIQAGQKQQALAVDVPGELVVVAERRKLSQILINLVGNAVKFTPDGGWITLAARRIWDFQLPSCDLEERDPTQQSQIANRQSAMVEIAVEDTGIGIAPEDRERIFQGLEQGDGSATRRHGGAGIGLALVRTLVELHGGRVWAESGGLGKGTRLVVRLPLLDAPAPHRVLVVEDEPAIREALGLLLEHAGYAVEGVENGTETLAAVRAEPRDVIVLDIGLPDMSGWEVLRRIREDRATREIPVVVLTGLAEHQAERAAALGADEFLSKPVSPTVLVDVVERLRRRRAAPRLTGGR